MAEDTRKVKYYFGDVVKLTDDILADDFSEDHFSDEIVMGKDSTGRFLAYSAEDSDIGLVLFEPDIVQMAYISRLDKVQLVTIIPKDDDE